MQDLISLISEEDLEKLAREENILRLSDWYIGECDRVANIPNGWMDVTNQLQSNLVSKYYKENNDAIVYLLREAHNIYPNNLFFKERIQVKYNKARIGELKIGDKIPDFMKDKLASGVNIFIGSSMT
jgi:hypothetical protein